MAIHPSAKQRSFYCWDRGKAEAVCIQSLPETESKLLAPNGNLCLTLNPVEPLPELKWELMSPVHLPGPFCYASEKITQLRQWEQNL